MDSGTIRRIPRQVTGEPGERTRGPRGTGEYALIHHIVRNIGSPHWARTARSEFVRCGALANWISCVAIDFTLTEKQREIQESARDFARNQLAPITDRVDAEPDPLKAFQLTKEAYAEACRRGIAFSMLPAEYGGGLSNVDFVIAAEEIQAVDPGFGTTVLVNGLGLMPVWYYGTEEQKKRFIGTATADQSGEFIVGYAASEPAGTPGGTANFDAPAIDGAGMHVSANRR